MSQPGSPAAEAHAAAPGPRVCKSCSAVLGGAYCAACGQESRIETPTVGEFVREFVQDQMALEGKLLRTLKLLVSRPGQLTLDYISGRRQCYLRPLRLYLALSVVFFAVSGLFGQHDWIRPEPGDEDKPLFSLDQPEASAPAGGGQKPAAAAAGSTPAAAPNASADHVFDGARDFNTGYPRLDARIHKFFRQTQRQASAQLSQAVDSDAPIAMFFLLPLFASLLQLAYLRHHLRYGVHLLFSLHYHAFVFLDLLLQEIPWPSIVDVALDLALPAYLVLALRRVYGGRLWSTALRVAVLMLIYVILIGITMFGTAVVALAVNG